jgi:hypothetical protein
MQPMRTRLTVRGEEFVVDARQAGITCGPAGKALLGDAGAARGGVGAIKNQGIGANSVEAPLVALRITATNYGWTVMTVTNAAPYHPLETTNLSAGARLQRGRDLAITGPNAERKVQAAPLIDGGRRGAGRGPY